MSGIIEKWLADPESMRNLLSGGILMTSILIFGLFSSSIIRTKLQNRRAQKMPGLKMDSTTQQKIWQQAKASVQSGWQALRYLTTQREWRYKTSWHMLLGEQGSGKTTLLKSIHSGQRQRLLLKERNLSAQGTGWNFFNNGIVIDIEGCYFDALEGTPENYWWDNILDLIQRHRPERPLDGIILTIPADILLGPNKEENIQRLGDKFYKQLWKIQKQYAFVLPVYLVVTKCDYVRGFNDYWQPFSASIGQEIFGWSNDAALDKNFSTAWIDKAFSDIESSLHAAQLNIAAANNNIENTDEFFLFPENLRQLKSPTQKLLGKVFEESAFHESFFLRGIYFTGAHENSPEISAQAQPQKILFSDQLFETKVFAEKNLARVVHQHLISRNRFIRKIQYSSIAFFLLLCSVFALSKISLDRQIESVTRVLRSVQGVTLDCITDTKKMHALLINIAHMDGNSLSRPGIPVSWISSVDNDLSEYLASAVFADVIFPNMECLFHKKLQAMIYTQVPEMLGTENSTQRFRRIRKSLTERIQDIEEYERGKAIFSSLSLDEEDDETDELKQFSELTNYLYNNALPPEFYRGKKLYEDALQRVAYEEGSSIRNKKSPLKSSHLEIYPKLLIARVGKISRQLHASILETAVMPERLSNRIAALQNGNIETGLSDRPVLFTRDVEDFSSWFSHLKTDWLLHDKNKNTCTAVQQELDKFIQIIKPYQYPLTEMNSAMENYSNDNCYLPFMASLTANRLAGIGQLFHEKDNNILAVRENAGNLLDNLSTLNELSYLSIQVDPAITPQLPVRYWDVAKLHAAIDYYAEYESFTARHKAYAESGEKTAAGQNVDAAVTRIYKIVIQAKLQQVIVALLKQAQLHELPNRESSSGSRPLSAKEERIAFQVQNFKKVSVELQQLRVLFAQSGWQEDYAWLTSTTRSYAVGLLDELSELVNESRLYAASTQPRWDTVHFADALYDLNDDIQIKDYLKAQQSRIEYITYNYAEPLINYIINTDEAGFQNGISTISLWENTLDEVNRQQRKDPASRLNQLDQYFLLSLTKLNQQNCRAALEAALMPVRGSDIFSLAQKKIENSVSQHCQNFNSDIVEKQYQELAEAFNQLLAGRFPFSNALDAGRYESEINEIKTFFDLYRNYYEGLYEKLKFFEKEPRYRDAIRFSRDLEMAARFFNAIFVKDKNDIITQQSVHIKINFKAYPDYSPGENQIVNWSINNGQDSVEYPDGDKGFSWLPGQPLRLTLRWASGSAFEPVKIAGALQPDISDHSAIFASGGQWALVQFLQTYKASGVVRVTQPDSNIRIVEFNTPVNIRNAKTPAESKPGKNVSKTYLRISLYGLDPVTRQETPLIVPYEFPAFAPEIKGQKP